MNIQDLDEFLHIDTSGEKWHLKHPGELSPFYAHLPLHNYQNMQCYYFDFANTLKTDQIGVVKESRYTTIPPHYHKDEARKTFCNIKKSRHRQTVPSDAARTHRLYHNGYTR